MQEQTNNLSTKFKANLLNFVVFATLYVHRSLTMVDSNVKDDEDTGKGIMTKEDQANEIMRAGVPISKNYLVCVLINTHARGCCTAVLPSGLNKRRPTAPSSDS
jgi:hypothetical protein